MDYCIQTIASVSKVKWRPTRKYHVASSSLVVDFTINVWDYRRPYVPFASFIEHKDVVTGNLADFLILKFKIFYNDGITIYKMGVLSSFIVYYNK